ncbi:MAG: hypothetical protein NTZ85_02635 [Bacteroidia bacterium]|nr:hypothetical protein [Bacteroidia bacterium]
MEDLISLNYQSYLTDTLALQGISGKTFKSRLADCLTALIASLIVFLIAFLLRYFGVSFTEMAKISGIMIIPFILFLITIIASPFIFLLSFVMLLYYYFKPQKTIICPFCENTHKIYSNVKSYVCDGCKNSIMFSQKESALDLHIFSCLICGSKWATTNNYGEGQCYCCGAFYNINETLIESVKEDYSCPVCNNELPKDLFVCYHCGEILLNPITTKSYSKTDNAFTMMFSRTPIPNNWGLDSITQRNNSDLGYLINSIWRLKKINDDIQNKKLPSDLILKFKESFELLSLFCLLNKYLISDYLIRMFDYILLQLYENLIKKDQGFYFYFTKRDTIKTYNNDFKKISDLYVTMINSNKFTSEKMNIWPNPIVNLEYDKTEFIDNHTFYQATVTNTVYINKFISAFDKNSYINFRLDQTILSRLTKIQNP